MARKARTIVLWTLSLLLAAMFLLSGSGKLRNAESSEGVPFDEQFELWGYPSWFRIPVGLAEVAGALLLLIPRTRFYGAATLTLVMAGAVVTHLRLAEVAVAAIPFVLGASAAVVAGLTRPAWWPHRVGQQPSRVA